MSEQQKQFVSYIKYNIKVNGTSLKHANVFNT